VHQKVLLWFRVGISGLTAHAGTRYYGVSAIDKALKLIKSIPYLEEKRNKKLYNLLYKDYEIGFPINVGVIKGGEWPSSVPSNAEFEARLGISPDEDPKLARKEVEEYIIEIAKQDSWLKDNLPKIEWFGNQCLAAQISKEHPIIKTIEEVLRENFYNNPCIAGVPWGTDGVKLINNAGVPTVIFGPGTMRVAHMADEYIEIQKLIKYTQILAISILRWCGITLNS
jgi:acetylornithine deacetylase